VPPCSYDQPCVSVRGPLGSLFGWDDRRRGVDHTASLTRRGGEEKAGNERAGSGEEAYDVATTHRVPSLFPSVQKKRTGFHSSMNPALISKVSLSQLSDPLRGSCLLRSIFLCLTIIFIKKN
jgi:hypothetical protein